MAAAVTMSMSQPIGGGKYLLAGSFTDVAASAGTSLNTGFYLEAVAIAPTTAAALACTKSGSTITIVGSGTEDGSWIAIGRKG